MSPEPEQNKAAVVSPIRNWGVKVWEEGRQGRDRERGTLAVGE